MSRCGSVHIDSRTNSLGDEREGRYECALPADHDGPHSGTLVAVRSIVDEYDPVWSLPVVVGDPEPKPPVFSVTADDLAVAYFADQIDEHDAQEEQR